MKLTHETGDPRSLTLLEENARYMRHETFSRLVDNIARYGVLQQWPLVWHDVENDQRVVLSGNHRVEAAMQAGLDVIDWTQTDEPLTEDQRKSITLSHNSLVGEDDPTILKRMYESIRDVEERLYSGLNDETLGLMEDIDTSSLAEVNLDFTSLAVVFLPSEYERALDALTEASRMVKSDATWLARNDQHQRTLDALEDARESAHVMNAATGLDLLLDVWDQHREDLRDNWLDGEYVPTGNTNATAPITSIAGYSIRTDEGARLAKALDKIIARGQADSKGAALRLLAERYLEEG